MSQVAYIQKNCDVPDRNKNFCHLCASFISDSKISRSTFTKVQKDRYYDVFGFKPRFLGLPSTGE